MLRYGVYNNILNISGKTDKTCPSSLTVVSTHCALESSYEYQVVTEYTDVSNFQTQLSLCIAVA